MQQIREWATFFAASIAVVVAVGSATWGIYTFDQKMRNIENGFEQLSGKVAALAEQSGKRKSGMVLKGNPGPKGDPGPEGPRGPQGIAGPQSDTGSVKNSNKELASLQARVLKLEELLKSGSGGESLAAQTAKAKALLAVPGTVSKGAAVYTFSNCSSESGNIYCYFKVTNKSKKDIRACIGGPTKTVSDTGIDIDNGQVKIGNEAGSPSACDVIAPLVTVNAHAVFYNDARHFKGKIQFLRIGCGGSCKYEAYNVPLE